MGKRALLFLLSLCLSFSLCGCWNYRGLDQMNIVTGITVDYDKTKENYLLSFEVADLAGAGKKESFKGRVIQSEGKTLFDAVRNAKRKEADKMFFGAAHILIISQELAEESGILRIIEWFLRDGECRENMCFALSQADTAEEILEMPEGMEGMIMSVNLHNIIVEDSKVSASSLHMKLYEAYNLIKSQRNSVMLPALRINKDQKSREINGIGIFKEDKLKGYLTPDESKYALFVEDRLQGGILTLSTSEEQTDNVTLEIFENKTKKSFTYEQGKVKIKIETDTYAGVGENQDKLDLMEKSVVEKIERAASRKIEKNITDLVHKMQIDYSTDAFGFGEMIYKEDLKLWKSLSPFWDELFPTLEIEVSSKVQIFNSAFIS